MSHTRHKKISSHTRHKKAVATKGTRKAVATKATRKQEATKGTRRYKRHPADQVQLVPFVPLVANSLSLRARRIAEMK